MGTPTPFINLMSRFPLRLGLWLLTLDFLGNSCSPAQEPRASSRVSEPAITAADQLHWSFQKPVPQVHLKVRDATWPKNPLDEFLLAGLEKARLGPAPDADRIALLRRITFDLIGLPPTPEEVDHFVHDSRADAYARVVDRLLASPHYGERWAQHWLDVVRYAESNGFEADAERPHAWRYRDYVVDAFNKDMPYDQFVTEQLAGDLLLKDQDKQKNSSLLIAGGFHRCGQIHLTSGNTDAEENRQEVLTEMTATVSSAILGLTVGCARCHHHKFDPISQPDYYRLQAFFAGTRPREIEICSAQQKAASQAARKKVEEKIALLRKKVEQLEEPYKKLLAQLKQTNLEAKYRDALDLDPKKRTPEQKKLAEQAQTLIKVTWDEILEALSPAEKEKRAVWRAEINALEAQMPPPPDEAWTIAEEDRPPPTYILKRGDVKRKGPEVQPAFPRVLLPLSGQSDPSRGRLTRLDLARWLTRPDHPLTARVLVNRLWQHHFGQGLVGTPNDFGLHGERPSHPELLDWLANEFVNHGWSIKHIQRLMVLSRAYQQTSQVADATNGKKIDPSNRLLWCMNRRRLEGETLRDAVLATSGSLYPKVGGPMIRVPLEPEVYDLIFTEGEPDGLWPVTPDVREHGRRTLYLFAKRTVRLPLLEVFDRPDMVTSCPVRPVSTFAPQALIMINGPFMQEQSKKFASRLLRECGSSMDRQIERAYHLSLGRLPRDSEKKMARDFLTEQALILEDRLRARKLIGMPPDLTSSMNPAASAALADFCLAILNRNEFVYVN